MYYVQLGIKIQFSTNISSYFGNGAIQNHSYYIDFISQHSAATTETHTNDILKY